jgi:hypothetical protein
MKSFSPRQYPLQNNPQTLDPTIYPELQNRILGVYGRAARVDDSVIVKSVEYPSLTRCHVYGRFMCRRTALIISPNVPQDSWIGDYWKMDPDLVVPVWM